MLNLTPTSNPDVKFNTETHPKWLHTGSDAGDLPLENENTKKIHAIDFVFSVKIAKGGKEDTLRRSRSVFTWILAPKDASRPSGVPESLKPEHPAASKH